MEAPAINSPISSAMTAHLEGRGSSGLGQKGSVRGGGCGQGRGVRSGGSEATIEPPISITTYTQMKGCGDRGIRSGGSVPDVGRPQWCRVDDCIEWMSGWLWRTHSRNASGTSPAAMRRARPSMRAVLPTPGSPSTTGLFLVRRESTLMSLLGRKGAGEGGGLVRGWMEARRWGTCLRPRAIRPWLQQAFLHTPVLLQHTFNRAANTQSFLPNPCTAHRCDRVPA